MELKPKRTDYSQNRGEFGITRWRQRFVEALPAKACLSRELRHAFCTRDVA